MSEMTPREIVSELDKHIIGQKDTQPPPATPASVSQALRRHRSA